MSVSHNVSMYARLSINGYIVEPLFPYSLCTFPLRAWLLIIHYTTLRTYIVSHSIYAFISPYAICLLISGFRHSLNCELNSFRTSQQFENICLLFLFDKDIKGAGFYLVKFVNKFYSVLCFNLKRFHCRN